MSRLSPAQRWTFLIVLVALGVRLGPMLWTGELRDGLQYDDGVYFSGSQHLFAGDLPYRDFVILHPPGILVLLIPFAAASDLVTDSGSLAAARLLFVVIGLVNTLLVARLLRPYGIVAIVAGAGFYAVWSGSALVERSVLHEPLLNLSLLLVLSLFSRGSLSLRRVALAGALLGSAAAFKVWAGPEVIVLAGWLLLAQGWRAAGAWLIGASTAFLLWVGPFLAVAPSEMYNQVILDQIQRPVEGVSLASRVRYFVGLEGIPEISERLASWAFVATGVVVAAAILVAVWRADPLIRLWALLLTVQVAEILWSPVFFYRYTALAAPTLCLLLGFTVARATAAVRASLRRPAYASGFVLLALLAISSVRLQGALALPFPSKLASGFAAHHRCVWALTPAMLILADASLRQIEANCEQWVDPYGALLDLSRDSDERGAVLARAPRLETWQAGVRRQLGHSDAALIFGSELQQGQGWDRRTVRFFRKRFRPVRREGEYVFWVAARHEGNTGGRRK
jgi:alpha-1,2-mannosyltransferase